MGLVTWARAARAEDGSVQDDAAGWGPPAAGTGTPPEAMASSVEPAAQAPEEPSPLHLQFSLRARGGLWSQRFQDNPFAQARVALDVWATYAHEFRIDHVPAAFRASAGVHGEFDGAYLYEPHTYDDATRDLYEHQVYQRESVASVTLGRFEVAAGRMIIPLGQAEVLNRIDVLSPKDLREPGLTEADRLRLPVLASRITLATEHHRLDAYVVHEAFFGLVPPPLGIFSPFRELLVQQPFAGPRLLAYQWSYVQVPEGNDPGNWQYLGHYGLTAGSLDLDVYGGSVLDQLGVPAAPAPAAYAQSSLQVAVYHPRNAFAATSGSWTLGAFLLRWELAAAIDRSQTVRRVDVVPLDLETERRTQLDGLLGVTYFAPFDANIGLEVAKSQVIRSPDADPAGNVRLLWPVERPAVAARWTQNLFRQRVQITLLGVEIGLVPLNGGLGRAEVAYLLRDGVEVGAGYIHYLATSEFGPFFGFERNDRAYLDFRWNGAIL